jgi:hypothetical protein
MTTATDHYALAPFLGHLAGAPSAMPFDDLRLEMIDKLVSSHAAGALSHDQWLAAWENAVVQIRDRLVAGAEDQVKEAGRVSRYPARRLKALLPGSSRVDLILHRLLSSGLQLERLSELPPSESGLRHRGAALELAWQEVVGLALQEQTRWRGTASQVRDWRRPWRPLVITGGVLVLLGLVAALWIGGFLPAPQWFTPAVDWFWGLSWR